MNGSAIRRKNFIKFTGLVFLYAFMMATIYFTFKHYTSGSEANGVLGVMIFVPLYPAIARFLYTFLRNRTAKKINE